MKRTIVFMDDSATIRLTLSEALTEAGYAAHPCETWEQTLKAVFVEQPELVLLDVQMPKTSGASVAVVLKKNYPDAKVVYLSSVSESRLKQLAAETGADGYIQKSHDLAGVVSEITRWLDTHCPERPPS